jgi:hypothetical protein
VEDAAAEIKGILIRPLVIHDRRRREKFGKD